MSTACTYRILDAPLKDTQFFSPEQKQALHTIPQHIAFIQDGNRRWAIEHNESYMTSYLRGATRLIETTLAAKELGVSVVTFFSFSTENWKRPKAEVDMFLDLMNAHLLHYAQSLANQDIRLHVIGNHEQLPSYLQETIRNVTKDTEAGKSLDLVLALNYGGRDELVRAIHKIVEQHDRGCLDVIDEQTIARNLDTYRWPDPDLLIRTSGEQRLSNFLLWQCSYTEHYVESAYWPDFSPKHLFSALETYQLRKRRRGGG
jgi:undecaprenyl diphosphate synthase